MRADIYFRTFERILYSYDFSVPLHRFLPIFFRKNPKMGSKDRKQASRLIHHFFRIGRLLKKEPLNTRLAIAEFLCSSEESSIVSHYKPEWEDKILFEPHYRLRYLKEVYPEFDENDIFPLKNEFSESLNTSSFLLSHLTQPLVFIRVNPDKLELVKQTLDFHKTAYNIVSEQCLSVEPSTPLDKFFPDQQPFEIQDWSSQQTGAFFQPKDNELWWDACAGSGGKSLLLHAINPSVRLYVSDIRPQILNNLEQRFQDNGIKQYQCKEIDLSSPPIIQPPNFDGIILDAPCSGSGTWGRTPENLIHFKQKQLQQYQTLQQKIIRNTIPYLKKGQAMIYITCSVFKQENEENVAFAQSLGMTLETQALIQGYPYRADSMFVARLIKA